MTSVNDEVGHAALVEFWQRAREGQLVVQRCVGCGAVQLYPRPFCLRCDCRELDWLNASGRGRVTSATVVHVSVIPDLETPYQVALVELAEGPMVLGRVRGPHVAIGDSVRLAWSDGEHRDFPVLSVTSEGLDR